LHELRQRFLSSAHLTLGALTTYADLRADPTVLAEFPMLAAAARETGSIAIQNRGTLGGNIANASPAADSPPPLLAYGAELELI
jgi:CO/xanthine dehydrogenase FAD-binding subunit